MITAAVGLPDGQRFFTVSRTTERPVCPLKPRTGVWPLHGCAEKHAERVVYASGAGHQHRPCSAGGASKIGINCHLCPRHNCGQRAHDPIVTELSTDTKRRGGRVAADTEPSCAYPGCAIWMASI